MENKQDEEEYYFDYETICDKALHINELNKDDYQKLVFSIVNHILSKYNLDKEISVKFRPLQMYGRTIGTNTIELNKKMLKTDGMFPFLNAYNTICHEIAHILDDRQNNTLPNDQKRWFFNGGHTEVINSFAKVNPLKFLVYECYSEGEYIGSRSETFARLFAIQEQKKFVEDMYALTKNKYKLKLGEPKTFSERLVEKGICSMYKAYMKCVITDEKINKIYSNFLKVCTKKTVQRDYAKIATKILDSKKHLSRPYKNMDTEMLSWLLEIPNLYNTKLADKFLKHFEKEEDYETCLDIAQMKTVHKPKKYIDAIYNKILTKNQSTAFAKNAQNNISPD